MKSSAPQRRNPRLRIGKYYTSAVGTAFLFLLPTAIVFGMFKYYPLVDNFMISLTSWDFFGPRNYVGLDNYTKLFKSSIFWNVVRNTFHYAISVSYTHLRDHETMHDIVFRLMLEKK